MLLDKLIVASSFQTSIKWLNRFISIISAVVLARILDPQDFGLMALAVSITTVFESFTSIGLNAKLIQGKKIADQDYNVAWTYGYIARAILLYLIIFLASDWISEFYNNFQLALIIKVLGLTQLINGFGNVWIIEQIREINFKVKFYVNIIGSGSRLFCIIPLAFYLKNVWALVFGLLIQNSARVIAQWLLIKKKPSFDFNLKVFKRLLFFGLPLFGSQILLAIRNSLDKLVIGKLLTVDSLGYYHIANRFGFEVTSEIKSVISSLLFPAFSKLKNQNKDLKVPLFDSLFVTLLISTPLILFLFYNTENLILLLLGEKWLPAKNAMKILVIGGYFQIVNSIFVPFFKSSGKPGYEFILLIFQFSILIPSIVKLKIFGIEGIAFANALSIFLSVILVLILANRIISFSILEIFKRLSPLVFIFLLNTIINELFGSGNFFLLVSILVVTTLVYYMVLIKYFKINILIRLVSSFSKLIKYKR